jgi:hypothetical protein
LVQDVVQVRREDDRDHLPGPPYINPSLRFISLATMNTLRRYDSLRRCRAPLQRAIGGTYRTWHAALGP